MACICLSWGNSACAVTGSCVCLQSTRHVYLGTICQLLLTVFYCHFCLLSPGKHFSLCNVWVHYVSIRVPHDFPEVEILSFMFPPMTARCWPHTLSRARPAYLYSKYSRTHFNHMSSESSHTLLPALFSFTTLQNIYEYIFVLDKHVLMYLNNHETDVWMTRVQGDYGQMMSTPLFCLFVGWTLVFWGKKTVNWTLLWKPWQYLHFFDMSLTRRSM